MHERELSDHDRMPQSETEVPRCRKSQLRVGLAETHLDDLADMLWRHVFFGRLDIAEFTLVRVSLGVQLMPLAGLGNLGSDM